MGEYKKEVLFEKTFFKWKKEGPPTTTILPSLIDSLIQKYYCVERGFLYIYQRMGNHVVRRPETDVNTATKCCIDQT